MIDITGFVFLFLIFSLAMKEIIIGNLVWDKHQKMFIYKEAEDER